MTDKKQYRIEKHHSDNTELIFHKGENNKRHEGLVCRLDRLLSNGVES